MANTAKPVYIIVDLQCKLRVGGYYTDPIEALKVCGDYNRGEGVDRYVVTNLESFMPSAIPQKAFS